jgi:hypothetical protein
MIALLQFAGKMGCIEALGRLLEVIDRACEQVSTALSSAEHDNLIFIAALIGTFLLSHRSDA